MLAAALVAVVAGATDYPLAYLGNTLNLTNTISLGTTNSTPVTNDWRIEQGKYHNVVVSLTTTNVVRGTNYLSLDGQTWFLWFTNLGAGATFQTNMTARWYWYRQIYNGSNVTGTIRYLGGN